MTIGVLMIIISNYYGIKCIINLLQLEPRNDMFKAISDIMAHCYDMYNHFLAHQCNENNWYMMIIISNHYGIEYLSYL